LAKAFALGAEDGEYLRGPRAGCGVPVRCASVVFGHFAGSEDQLVPFEQESQSPGEYT
jgi:hypothetical protein